MSIWEFQSIQNIKYSLGDIIGFAVVENNTSAVQVHII